MGSYTMNFPTKIHPLHSVDKVANFVRDTGQYFNPERCTGRTTVIALRTIARAMENPRQWIKVEDHEGTLGANRHLLRVIGSALQALGLGYFRLDHNKLAICFGEPDA